MTMRDKVVLITGAARGQGRNHAVLCRQVPSVGYPMSEPADLEETAKLVEARDRRIVAVEADIRDPEALGAAISRGVAELGRLDVVVANAGIVSIAPSLDMTEDTWRDVVDINLTGVWRTVKLAAPHIIAGRRGGSVIITGSTCSVKAVPGLAHYTSAKHGLVGLMKTFAVELAEHAIHANLVLPTNTDTPMLVNDQILQLLLARAGAPHARTRDGGGIGIPRGDPAGRAMDGVRRHHRGRVLPRVGRRALCDRCVFAGGRRIPPEVGADHPSNPSRKVSRK